MVVSVPEDQEDSVAAALGVAKVSRDQLVLDGGPEIPAVRLLDLDRNGMVRADRNDVGSPFLGVVSFRLNINPIRLQQESKV